MLKLEISALYYAYRSGKVGLVPKLLLLLTLGYALSPIDLIPDFIPILGYVDDLIILPLLISLSIRFIPRQLMEECRQKARIMPLQLKKNWVFAALFVGVWITVLAVILSTILKVIAR